MGEENSTFLPLFPLQMVAFPGQMVNLHIFEPRYKELIRECEETGAVFGISPFHENRLVPYGTEMALVEVVKRYPNGELDIRVQGRRAFRLLRYIRDVPGHLYSAGDVQFIADEKDEALGDPTELVRLYSRLHELLGTGLVCPDEVDRGLAFRLAEYVGLDIPQKVRLLTMTRESERREFLADHLNRMIPLVEQAEAIKRRIGGNGHFHALPEFRI